MDDKVHQRVSANEATFRNLNEGIERGQWPGEPDHKVGFRCECARLGCNMLVELTLDEYERVRAHSRRFVMIRGHEIPELESVVETIGDYLIVEKQDEAGERAEATDPRSD